jgi:hypothetical protein
MISDALIWVGSNIGAVLCLFVAIVAIGVVIYVAKDFPPDPEEDEHARDRFI